jgi:hypothetical protein
MEILNVARQPRAPNEAAGSPREFATSTPPTNPMLDHSFGLQAIMEMQKSVGQLNANVERLIADSKSQGEKIDGLRHQATFIKGGLAASVFFITVIIAGAGWILNTKWEALLLAFKAVSK